MALSWITARRSPFIVGVNFDSNELTGDSKADEKSTTNESSEVPAGHVGFKLTYFQVACWWNTNRSAPN